MGSFIVGVFLSEVVIHDRIIDLGLATPTASVTHNPHHGTSEGVDYPMLLGEQGCANDPENPGPCKPANDTAPAPSAKECLATGSAKDGQCDVERGKDIEILVDPDERSINNVHILEILGSGAGRGKKQEDAETHQ